ncbi:MAG: phytanoyl-CoA dioxygenase family protein [Sneathiella sp.]|nr:phytanoyl-CoA dioxygenase family protein [Sneathiella sp.]
MSANLQSPDGLSKEAHAAIMRDYIKEGEARAMSLGNRGKLKLTKEGALDPSILDSYWKHGFYVFEGLVEEQELSSLRRAVDQLLETAPTSPDAKINSKGEPVDYSEYFRPPFRWAKPLSDPLGGTSRNKGRHPVEMQKLQAAEDAPDWTIEFLDGTLHLMDEALHLYGHPGLLAIAEAVNGPDFAPYNEVAFIKEAGLGPAVAWHQDGTTHWDAPDWEEGAHGFNFMTQLYPSTAGNCVWVLPGSHKLGKVDIKALVAASGSDRLNEAVPMICDGGDVMIMNRQLVHGSFANSSNDRRVTLNAGFFPLKRVLDVTTERLNGDVDTYSADRIRDRSRIIQLAIEARKTAYPDEKPYNYAPFEGASDRPSWSESTRAKYLFNYNRQDMYI